ncbi:hypothetical protein ACSZOJ_01385 [Aeromonas dhakensis]
MQIARYCQHGINYGRYGCLETVASLSAIKKRARVFFRQQGADPAALAEGASAPPNCWLATSRGIS